MLKIQFLHNTGMYLIGVCTEKWVSIFSVQILDQVKILSNYSICRIYYVLVEQDHVFNGSVFRQFQK